MFETHECLGMFVSIKIAMVAFASFVIETDNPPAIHKVDKPIFEAMRVGWDGVGHTPNDHFDHMSFVGDIPESVNQFSPS
jgi:hypothetical protein